MQTPDPPSAASGRPADDFYARVTALIAARDLIPEHSRIIVGVSGGPDSMALLAVLQRWQAGRSFALRAAHLNHGLRPAAAAADEDLVAAFCRQYQIPFFSRTVDIAGLPAARHRGLEAAGREARQAFFADLAAAWARESVSPADRQPGDESRPDEPPVIRIALAHHLDDQAESVLLHLGRGCGLDGLVGMQPLQGPLIRPLLTVRRGEIRIWLAGQGIPWRQDATNLQPVALRNRLRLQVLPAWADALGYDPAPALSRMADNLAADWAFLQAETERAWRQVACLTANQGPEAMPPAAPGPTVCLDCLALAAIHPSLQLRILRQAYRTVSGSGKDLEQKHVLLLQQMLVPSLHRKGLDLPGSVHAWCQAGRLYLSAPVAAVDEPAWPAVAIPLQVPGLTGLPAGQGWIEATWLDQPAPGPDCLPATALASAVLRLRQPGDTIRPAGRGGSKTLRKFFNEQKVPLSLRGRLPLLARGSTVIWIPGLACDPRLPAEPGGPAEPRPGDLASDPAGDPAQPARIPRSPPNPPAGAGFVRLAWHAATAPPDVRPGAPDSLNTAQSASLV